VAAVFAVAKEHHVYVTPRGLGSGKSGGALPIFGGIVLSMEKMTRIKEISRDDMLAIVEPGVITQDLMTAVESEQLFYPPDPNSLTMCSIGGNVACNAGGPARAEVRRHARLRARRGGGASDGPDHGGSGGRRSKASPATISPA